MRRSFVPGLRVHRRARRLEREEDEHARARAQEQHAAAGLVDERRGEERPGQVPDLQDAVDEQLDGRVRDADGVEDLVEVVRDEPVAGPLREEGERDDDAHAAAVAYGREERLPADGRRRPGDRGRWPP